MKISRCTRTVYWWDLGYTADCVRPLGHHGLHRDGTRWFDSDGFQQPRDPAEVVQERACRRLTPGEVAEIHRRHAAGETPAVIARALRLPYSTVYACAAGRTYRSVA